jgi:hypothetical protein
MASESLPPVFFQERYHGEAADVVLSEPGRGKLLLGAYSDALSLKQLLEHEVFFVVNCAYECPTPSIDGARVITTKRLELADDLEEDIFTKFGVIDDIHAMLELDKAVLVHCAAGVSRSATIVLAYLIRHRKLSLARAWEQVSEARFILPNLGFWAQLMRFELVEAGALSVFPAQLHGHPAWGVSNTVALFRGLPDAGRGDADSEKALLIAEPRSESPVGSSDVSKTPDSRPDLTQARCY